MRQCTSMLSVAWLLSVYCTMLMWKEVQAKPCTGREVYTASHGVITDGRGDYPASAHCEWLIHGKFLYYSACSPSVGFTSWRIGTMFTRSAITPP